MQDNNKLKAAGELNHPDRNYDSLQKSQGLNQWIKNFMGYFAQAKEKLAQNEKITNFKAISGELRQVSIIRQVL